MPKLTPKLEARFNEYLNDAWHSGENLRFLLDNLREHFNPDYSVESLEAAERAYWKHSVLGIPADISSQEQFAQLLGQYLGESIRHHTGANWTQCIEDNPMFAQPFIDSFGRSAWDRIYPVQLAIQINNLQESYPGAAEHRAFAATLERAIKSHKSKSS